MENSKVYRLNIKGISFNLEHHLLTIKVIPFVINNDVELEKKANLSLTLDLTDTFNSETHSSLDSLLSDLSKIRWFKTKNVFVEHFIDKDTGSESISILSNSSKDLEVYDMLYFGFDTDENNKRQSFCDLNISYFLSQQDCIFVRNSFVSFNEKNMSSIMQEQLTKKETAKVDVKIYSSKKSALQEISLEDRFVGQHVIVKLAKTKPKTYIFKEGITDKDLVLEK